MTGRLTCRELIDFLDDYVEHRLDPAARARFDDHLSRCAPCVRYLRSYQGTMRAVAVACGGAEASAAQAPEQLIAAILAARPR